MIPRAELGAMWRAFAREDVPFLRDPEAALVLADALAEYGYTKIASDLTKFLRRYGSGPVPRSFSIRDAYEKAWDKLRRRMRDAVYDVEANVPVWRRPDVPSAVLRYTHATSPRFDDVAGPFPASAADFVDPDAIREWFARVAHRSLGRVRQWRRRPGQIIIFPATGAYHSIVIEPAQTRLRLPAREVQEMARRLQQRGYLEPARYARRLYREGIGLESRWRDDPGPEGALVEGGTARRGRRYVAGLESRLWITAGRPGSLEVTHGFRRRREG